MSETARVMRCVPRVNTSRPCSRVARALKACNTHHAAASGAETRPQRCVFAPACWRARHGVGQGQPHPQQAHAGHRPQQARRHARHRRQHGHLQAAHRQWGGVCIARKRVVLHGPCGHGGQQHQKRRTCQTHPVTPAHHECGCGGARWGYGAPPITSVRVPMGALAIKTSPLGSMTAL